MGKAAAHIRRFFQPAVFFIPFTLYFILFALGGFIGYKWLVHKQNVPDTSFADIFSLLLKVALVFAASLFALALVSVIISLLYFLWKKRKNGMQFSLSSSAVSQAKDGTRKQLVGIRLYPLLKPFLGFIKLRLQYDGNNFTNKFSLIEHNKRKFFSSSYEGDYTWRLPEIKEYHVEKLILYFEDYFQFFSFALSMPVQNRFFTPPLSYNSKEFLISPRKTEETDTRIEELKKVEGEFLNYKNFENNDDVRRIVWKIYAKNKELVVRIPEILDPYASHAYLYASFFSDFEIAGNNTIGIYFLNYYKTLLWAIYEKLAEQGFEVKYSADQQISAEQFNSEKKAVQYSISTSKWQKDKDLKAYVKIKEASVLVVHSLSDAEQVGELLHASDGNTVFVFIRLSKSLDRTYWIGLLKWIFIQQEKNELEKYKNEWRFSLLRSAMMRNEKKLEGLLAKHTKTIVI